MKAFTLIAMSLLLPAAIGQNTGLTRSVPSRRDAAVEPAYDAQGRLQLPFQYREWVYLSSGIGMSYTPKPEMEGISVFDNVFVNPAAYRSFLSTGTWPDKTVMVLEQRGAKSRASINQGGNFESTQMVGFEVHVRDEARTPGGWAFYEFDNEKPAEQIPAAAVCYSCHEQHAAVQTTFVQFYPTLLPVAQAKKTLSAAYLKDLAAAP
ncbi:Cytochrome P460 [Acidisarcina polymorpha]|uniref:Cytochrome P460 n=1 Tax=Acidisarcina polymorpha TaxID=2211140 RepID=A0A2Z5G199_9BACT|nr:cytochrome P460 family protein [Acidisarcina polymorpha]AXC12849.1 Cytochrome P460 [Acidisarcina polymorpha]